MTPRALRMAALHAAALALLWTALAVGPATSAGPVPPPASDSTKSAVDSVRTPPQLARRVVACYFHTTQRCASCRRIEAWSREAIETAFADELKEGRLVWRMINFEEKGNEHFVKDYKLFTKSLIVIDEDRGRPVRWTNLDKVWQFLQNKPKFLRYVQEETRAYLAPTP